MCHLCTIAIHNITTWNDRKCPNTSKCLLRNGTKRKNTSSHIILDPSNVLSLLRTIVFVINNGERGERIFILCPVLGLQGILTGPNLHNAQLDHVFYILIKTITRHLRHKIRKKCFFTKSPCWAPWGPDWTKIAHAQLDHGTLQHETINGSLRHLVTEERKEQDIVYGKTAGWRTKGYRISSTCLWQVELTIAQMTFLCTGLKCQLGASSYAIVGTSVHVPVCLYVCM